ncbi:TAT-variant-translocated molybdopterin oxidoreductase [Microvirga sp. STR05]|uniref:TAT-variant-translocated molybdopterin oxidoreductase n=1 Tax=Hymenobacter duratus TaxID=2771356 RepID=A0ABR8JHI5_9BACT|nr:TAT-variant-translocated molybdopterin oxidoreductase [Hymenobacter duratus]MBD2714812.1 TAT-variant-translocated molybdopterin oxidoreductase [Hymenobacter duratus]MBR7949717.1 TAT-variant-translocated molybdopterin oxidoreductase [Microvirga sp. STR05]
MQESPKYWKGIEELENSPEFVKNALTEFADFLPVKETYGSSDAAVAPRRDFLKLMGFGIAAATLASCETPIKKAIPYLNKPEEVDPGIANFYASTYFNGQDYNSVLVKTREGRPIKLEGNPESPITRGGLSARAQASVLSLYDGARLQHFAIKGKKAEKDRVDQEIRTALAGAGRTVIVSPTIISPSTKKVIAEFASRYPGTEHVMYDVNSASGLLRANGGVLPSYDFSKADVIVSLGADFLGTWISPVEFARQYVANRKVSSDKRTMSRHFQFESALTLTGSNADVRVPVKPSEMGATAVALYNGVVGGGAAGSAQLKKAAAELKAAGSRGLVVSGSNDPAVQALVTAINQSLGSAAVDVAAPSMVRQGDDARMERAVKDIIGGQVGAVIFYNANPVFDHPMGAQLGEALKGGKVKTTISLNDRLDETGSLCTYAAPDHHWLESWNDYEPKRGFLSLAQPAISPLFATRQAQDSLLTWAGNPTSYYNYLRTQWKAVTGSDAKAWDKAVHDGVATGSALAAPAAQAGAAMGAAEAISAINSAPKFTGVELCIYEKVGVGNGTEANNPWLQELPDPVSKATWGNYVAVPRKMAEEKDWAQGDVLKVTANGKSIELPVLIQPGQAAGSVAIALGYGRTQAGKVADKVGENVLPFAVLRNGAIMYANSVTLEKTGATSPIAQTQTHHTIMDRKPVVQESTLKQYRENPKEVTEYETISTPDGPQKPNKVSLWQDYEYKNHHWGMAIDLNSCIGCGSCVVGCQAENNVAVVGKQEVINRREMHWMRIDRYYSSDASKEDFETKGKLDTYAAMEDPSENPSVIFQPMMCQHCNHAPCETVCPVLATTHSSEGLNQMTYNRCVGTRYCANNCPYKVRRFNWFSYYSNEKFEAVNGHMFTDLGRMVLNPDVTVRARGVMEKCSLCVQRIQLGKLEAKKQKRRPKDGEIVSACAQSCPTQAIVFGDMRDPESRLSKLLRREDGERAFHVLDAINVQPNMTYLTKIRNTEEVRNA